MALALRALQAEATRDSLGPQHAHTHPWYQTHSPAVGEQRNHICHHLAVGARQQPAQRRHRALEAAAKRDRLLDGGHQVAQLSAAAVLRQRACWESGGVGL